MLPKEVRHKFLRSASNSDKDMYFKELRSLCNKTSKYRYALDEDFPFMETHLQNAGFWPSTSKKQEIDMTVQQPHCNKITNSIKEGEKGNCNNYIKSLNKIHEQLELRNTRLIINTSIIEYKLMIKQFIDVVMCCQDSFDTPSDSANLDLISNILRLIKQNRELVTICKDYVEQFTKLYPNLFNAQIFSAFINFSNEKNNENYQILTQYIENDKTKRNLISTAILAALK